MTHWLWWGALGSGLIASAWALASVRWLQVDQAAWRRSSTPPAPVDSEATPSLATVAMATDPAIAAPTTTPSNERVVIGQPLWCPAGLQTAYTVTLAPFSLRLGGRRRGITRTRDGWKLRWTVALRLRIAPTPTAIRTAALKWGKAAVKPTRLATALAPSLHAQVAQRLQQGTLSTWISDQTAFTAALHAVLTPWLAHNGLLLDDVAVLTLRAAPKKAYRATDPTDAEALMQLALLAQQPTWAANAVLQAATTAQLTAFAELTAQLAAVAQQQQANAQSTAVAQAEITRQTAVIAAKALADSAAIAVTTAAQAELQASRHQGERLRVLAEAEAAVALSRQRVQTAPDDRDSGGALRD